MQPQIMVGRIFGIAIGLHYSWFIIAFLITLSLGWHFQSIYPDWGESVIWGTALATGLLFFVAIVLHELAHALVAKARHLPVRSITLFALGGIAGIEKETADPKTEFWMGIAGPIASVLIGTACLGVVAGLYGTSPARLPASPAQAMLVWLGYINLMLAAFNMIPGFPLDGGRVLRAIIWWITGNAERATRLASRVGQIVALGFIFLGFFQFFGGSGIGGLWLALIGWFLLDAAGASYAQVEMIASLRGLRVRDIMANDCARVDGRLSLKTFIDEYVLRTGRRCFVVEGNSGIVGLITPSDVKEFERERWPTTTVEMAMRPLSRLRTVAPESPVTEALEAMGREDLNQLPVMSKGRMEGILSRSHILQLLQSRAELSM
jgi:Zn-dependent protease/predicted transcriptional regulator